MEAGPYAHILGWYSYFFLLNFDTDNCLLKKFHYTFIYYEIWTLLALLTIT
jgi:hypothetical protein